MSRTVMILIDGFSRAYLSTENTPYMSSLGDDGTIYDLNPMFAFRGIEATIFTGYWPEDHGAWTEYRLRASARKSRKLSTTMIRLADALIPNDPLRIISRNILRGNLKHSNFEYSLVPPESLGSFELSMKKKIFESRALDPIPTLYDLMNSKGIPYAFLSREFLKSDKIIAQEAIRIMRARPEVRFIFLKFADLDALGHRFGPDVTGLSLCLQQIDKLVELVTRSAEEVDGDIRILVLSDHGMSKNTRYVDVINLLTRMEASRIYEDFLMFVDSTMVRFWFLNRSAKDTVMSKMESINGAHHVNRDELRSHRLPLDPRYGEEVFVLDEGSVFAPDFFHRSWQVQGMHGYASIRTKEGMPIALANGNLSEVAEFGSKLEFADIFGVLTQSIGLSG